MKLFDVGNTSVKFNPLLLVPIIYYVLNDGLNFVVMLFTVLSLHELSHTVMANILSYKVESIELHPFGFEARLAGEFKSAHDEFAIALAGPLFSILSGLCCLAFKNTASNIVLEFAELSVTLGILNTVPAYPLDGGRILYAILYLKTDAHKAKKISIITGFCTAAVLSICACTVKPFNPSLMIFAFFIAFADIAELKKMKTVRISSVLKSRSTLRNGESLPVKFIALNKNVTYSQAMRHIGSNTYTVIAVLDDDMKEVDWISQNKLLEKAAELNEKKDTTVLHE